MNDDDKALQVWFEPTCPPKYLSLRLNCRSTAKSIITVFHAYNDYGDCFTAPVFVSGAEL